MPADNTPQEAPPPLVAAPRWKEVTFYATLLALLFIFFWSRINLADRIFFFGDGTVTVELISEMLATGDWTADVSRVANRIQIQPEWHEFSKDIPLPGRHYFNLSGYMVLATAVCKGLQLIGLGQLSIPSMLRSFNLFLQSLTLVLLFLTGKKIAGRGLGLTSMTSFVFLPLAVTEVNYERPECWLVFLSAIILFSLLTYKRAPKRSVAVIGFSLGLSMAVKFSQLFLGIIPAVLFLEQLFQPGSEAWPVRIRRLFVQIFIMGVSIILALLVNVPFIFYHLEDYFQELSVISSFYDSPHPLYSAGHEGYFPQFLFILNYFWKTLGPVWCLFLCFGLYQCLVPKNKMLILPAYFKLSLSIPLLFILFYMASKYNFFERFFSANEPMICIVSALGVYVFNDVFQTGLRSRKTPPVLFLLAGPLLMGALLWQPALLNYRFVKHYIHQSGFEERIAFQDKLKKDFPGFWIKNVHITLSFSQSLPEKPGKAPRIYHLEDYNQHWSIQHLEKLQQNGFIHIATYCSDFWDLPVSNQTIYHAAARDHYLVRRDEWPDSVPADYFRTNCK